MNCCLYVVDTDSIANAMLLNSIQTLKTYNPDVLCFCITSENNDFLEKIKAYSQILLLEKYPSILEKIQKIKIYNDKNIANNSKYSFIRLFLYEIPELHEFDKILYLDIDTEIYGDVSAIFAECRPDDFFIGFNESIASHARTLKSKMKKYGSMFKQYSDPYINTGVIIINNTEQNRELIAKNIDSYLKLYDELKLEFIDQDIINAFFHTRAVHPSFISFPLGYPSIIYHFVGQSKNYLLRKISDTENNLK